MPIPSMLMPLILIACAAFASSATAAPDAPYKIVTASKTGTYIEIGRDLSKYVAEPAAITLEALESKGSAENVQRLRYEPGVKLALVQSDVYQAFLDEAKTGNAEAGNIIRPLRVVMPLYDEEIHFVVRADSPLQYIHELKGKKIAIGPLGSGTALTSRTLYQLMFGEPIPPDNREYLSNEDALAKLTVDKSIDAVVIIAGQPAKLFADMKADARKFIKLLKLDEAAPETVRARKTYFPATIRAGSYQTWLPADVPSLTVKAYLVTYDYNLRSTVGDLSRFADSLCMNFDKLQASGHPKWKQVKLELPALNQGWRYFGPMEKRMRGCIAARTASAASGATVAATPAKPQAPVRPCSEQELVLGICRR